MYKGKRLLEQFMILIVDLISLFLGLSFSYLLRFHVFLGKNAAFDCISVLLLLYIVYIFVQYLFNFYRRFFRRGYFEELVSVLQSAFVGLFGFIFLLFVFKQKDVSRLAVLYCVILSTIFMYVNRILFKRYMIKSYKVSNNSHRIIIVARKNQCKEFLDNYLHYHDWSRYLVGFCLLDDETETEMYNVPVVCHKDDFLNYLIFKDIDEVFFFDRSSKYDTYMKSWIPKLETMGTIISINIDGFNLLSGTNTLSRIGKYAVVTGGRNLYSFRQLFTKRMLDILGGIVGIILFGISYVFIAPIIKLTSKGPVIYKSTRIGKNGRQFTFYKYRSMVSNADDLKEGLMDKNEVDGLMFKIEDDPRITKIGKFLRKTSLDELPQFINVLRGDMSLVGTRPPTLDEYEKYDPVYKGRLSMKPGITGLWQVSGRSDITDFDEVVKLDMEYIDNWSVKEDIKILLLTLLVVIKGRGSK